MATKLQICNMALRLLHVQRIVQADLDNETNEQSRVLNDVYGLIRDEVLATHPWNFAIKRDNLTEVGGTVSGWIATGTTNVWQATLTTQPARVEFDGIEGTEQTSLVACDAERDWYWASDVLYAYYASTYTEIEALIPEFDWDHAFSLPSDYLRAIKVKDDADFVREGNYLFSDEGELKIQYIAKITDETKFSPAFVTAFAARLAAELAMPLTENASISEALYSLYQDKIKMAKGIDAQEGVGQKEEDLSWEDARE